MLDMSKKVVVLSASARKGGNSEMLCDEFIAGAKESGNRVEKIFLGNKIINYCIGCEFCTKNGGKCIHNDDMGQILEKIIEADVIVMATPVYYYSMNGQMKTLIDRTVAKNKEIRDKEFYFILAAANPNKEEMESVLKGFRGFTRCLSEAKEKGIIYGTGAWAKGEIQGSLAMKQSYEMGKRV
jgi:Multimeric flavodoxin WrbA